MQEKIRIKDNFIEIDDSEIKEDLNRENFEKFLNNTNLRLEGNIGFDLIDNSSTWREFWYGRNILARIYFHDDYISANCEKCNLKRVKRLFEDFVKVNPIKINIKVEKGDC